MKILDSINSPADLKNLTVEQLEVLAQEMREFICEVVSKNGGHLAPSLGVVELSLALHSVFNCPKDKIIWDVGHQSYTHKILTGRRKRFQTLRTEDGISGFPSSAESEADAFGTGHAATAISAALGLVTARDLKGTDEKIIAVVGDGSMTGGLSFEGLNNTGASHKDLLVVLNDNKMSISSNVGALSRYLTGVITTQSYNKLKKDIWELTGYIPAVKEPVRTLLNRVERSLKSLIVPGVWFESLGFRYFGPVDGHNLQELIQLLEHLKAIKGPLLLHVYTTKGKGYCFAEEDATKFHGISPFELKNGVTKKDSETPTYSQIFGDTLVSAARNNPSVCAITAAMKDSTGLRSFAEEFPERFFDVGIAEGHAVTFAAGLAKGGMKPFVAIYSTFLQRSYDSIIHDVALQNLPVVFCLDRAGFSGEDGPTHHGIFDLSYLRHIPGMVIMAPRDSIELQEMVTFSAQYKDGPISIRYPKGCSTPFKGEGPRTSIELGRAEVLVEGESAVLFAIGEMTHVALKSAKILTREGLHVTVVNMRFVKPLDTKIIDRFCEQGIPLITLEENVLSGGFGSGIIEYCNSRGFSPSITMVGIPDEFTGHAKRSRLLSRYGLDAESIAETVRKVVHNARGNSGEYQARRNKKSTPAFS